MNNARRKMIEKALEHIMDAQDILEDVRDDEQDAFDNLPEGIQESEKAGEMEENVYEIDDALDRLADIKSDLDDLITK